MSNAPAGLFGLVNSNRDFSNANAWGKNQFNSSFPAALSCYLHSKGLDCVYIAISAKQFGIKSIDIENIFGINPLLPDIYFAFEAQYTPFQKYVIGALPRTDLVILNKSTNQCLRGLEVKLTALPDNTTCNLSDDRFGSEIVIRPDSIVYLAASIASASIHTVEKHIQNSGVIISDWSDAEEVIHNIKSIVACILAISLDIEHQQLPFLLQPVWKTTGKSPKLADNCLDVFVWSDAAFAWFIAQVSKKEGFTNKITRQTRTSIWLYKMLLDIVTQGKFDHADIIDKLSYNTKNDKAFASAGNVTNPYMSCENLTAPRIKKDEIKHIILGDGQNLLSPERRFDAIIYNSPELFL
ncbi:MAG: HindVP family restriction endonuclease [Methylococcales bacterium]